MSVLEKSGKVPKLRLHTLRLIYVVVMTIAAVTPVEHILFNTIPQAGLVGAAILSCYMIGFSVVLLISPRMSEISVEL